MRYSLKLRHFACAALLLPAACAEPNSYPQQAQMMTPTGISASARAEASTTPTRHFSTGCNGAYEHKATGYDCRRGGNVIIVAPR